MRLACATELSRWDLVAAAELTGWDFIATEGELGTGRDGQGKAIETGFHGKLLRGKDKTKPPVAQRQWQRRDKPNAKALAGSGPSGNLLFVWTG